MKEAPENPPRGPAAFESMEDPAAIQAQAAILLAAGAQMRGDRAAVQAMSAVTAEPVDMLFRNELEEFPIPRLVPPGRRFSPRQIMLERFGEAVLEGAQRDMMVAMAEEMYQRHTSTSAAALVTNRPSLR